MERIKYLLEKFFGNKNTVLIIVIVFLSTLMLYYIVFVNKQSSQIIDNFFNKQESPQKTYPRLDAKLQNVIKSKNPEETAEAYNFDVSEDEVKALITLKDESFIFTPEYGKELLRYGKFIQASVKINMLEKLSENPKIESIASPLKGINKPK